MGRAVYQYNRINKERRRKKMLKLKKIYKNNVIVFYKFSKLKTKYTKQKKRFRTPVVNLSNVVPREVHYKEVYAIYN